MSIPTRDADLATEPLPVVYTDGAVFRVIEGLGALLTAAARTHQTPVTVDLVAAHTLTLPRLRSDDHRRSFVRSLEAALPTVAEQSAAPALIDALRSLSRALGVAGLDRRATERTVDVIRTAVPWS